MRECLRFEKGKIYEVEWLDHFSTDRISLKEALEISPMIIKTYGVYLGQNKNYIILCWHIEYNNEYNSCNNSCIHILKRNIKKVRELK